MNVRVRLSILLSRVTYYRTEPKKTAPEGAALLASSGRRNYSDRLILPKKNIPEIGCRVPSKLLRSQLKQTGVLVSNAF